MRVKPTSAFRFRVWDLERREMRHGPNFLIDSVGSLYWQFGFDEAKCLSRQDYEVVFGTGLQDKNGKEIYEGDIVYAEANDTTSVIKYGKHRCINSGYDDDFHFGFYTDHGDGGADETLYPDGTLYEVVGNIYENPELIRETNE